MFKKIFERKVCYINTSNYKIVEVVLKKAPNTVIELDGDRHLYRIRVKGSKFEEFISRPILTLLGKIYYKLFPDQEWV